MTDQLTDLDSEVYFRDDICRLYSIGINQVDRAILDGLVPKPLRAVSLRERKRWAKGVVHKHLGIEDPRPTREEIKSLIWEQLQLFREEGAE